MKLSLSLKPSLRLGPRLINPLLGLSSLELALLLERSRADLDQNQEVHPNFENSGSYYESRRFYALSQSCKGSVTRDDLLEYPEMIVRHDENGYSAQPNPYLEDIVARQLSEFKRAEGTTPTEIFSKRIRKERKWISEQQKAVLKYLCEMQEKYLQTGNPFDLVSMTQQQIAEVIHSTNQRVGGFVRNLTMQLPDGRVLFADELIPGAKLYNRQATYVLRELQKDPAYYEDGHWKVPDRELAPILASRGLVVKSDTVRKYRSMMN